MGKIVCFGELMLRLNPPGYLRIVQSDSFEASYAGGEANVAVSLANYGENASFVSVIPDNLIGQSAVNSLRRWGVDVSLIKRSGERLGIYFVEKGASQRASKVIYDRKYSAVALSDSSDYDWEEIFRDADWFHFTGITPALSDSLAKVCLEACRKARQMGVRISCDLNYRKNLWSREKAGEIMGDIVPYVDVLIANEEDAADVFGIKAADSDVENGTITAAGYKEVARQLYSKFGCKIIAITLRGSISANDNNWAGMLYTEENSYLSRNYLIHIVDRVGGGDSFGGGLIYALHNGFDPQHAIDFAVAASCLKQTIEQDFNHVSVQEVESLVNGSGTGRVQR